MCIIVPEEGDVGAFKSLTAADLGVDAGAPAAAPAPAPAAAAPAAAPAAGLKKDYPPHTPGTFVRGKKNREKHEGFVL